MAYIKRVSNAINTSTSVNNQVATLFSITNAPVRPETAFSQQIRLLDLNKQPRITETNKLSANLVAIGAENLEEVVERLVDDLSSNTRIISDIQTGGISSISVLNNITTIQGIASVEQIRFPTDASNVYQTTAFTPAIGLSLEQFGLAFTQVDASIAAIQTLQQTQDDHLSQLDASYVEMSGFLVTTNEYLVTVSAQINSVSISDLSAIAVNLENDTADLSIAYAEIQTQLNAFAEDASLRDASFVDLSGRVDDAFALFETTNETIQGVQAAQSLQLEQLDASYLDISALVANTNAYLFDVSTQINSVSIPELTATAANLASDMTDLSATYFELRPQVLDLTISAGILDLSFLNLQGRVDALEQSIDLSNASPDLDESISSITASLHQLLTNTQYIDVSQGFVPSTRISSNLIVQLPATQNTGFSIQTNADDSPLLYMNWLIGATAPSGIIRAGDVVMTTNCSGVAFAGINQTALKGLRIGLDGSSVLAGSDLSLTGNIIVSGDISCNALTTNRLTLAGINKRFVDITHSANTFTLNYALGDVFRASSEPTDHFSLNVTNIPVRAGGVNRMYNVEFYYTATFTPTTFTMTNTSGTSIRPATVQLYNGTTLSATANALKKCIITLLDISTSSTGNRLGVQLVNYA